jgi:hypothetical protein
VIRPAHDLIPSDLDRFREELKKLDLSVLTGGAREGSYISQLCGLVDKDLALPEEVAGDLAGHLLTNAGIEASVEDARILQVLASLRAEPSLDTIRELAKNKCVLIVLDEPDGGLSGGYSKLGLLKACLAGRLGTCYVVPRHLALKLLFTA